MDRKTLSPPDGKNGPKNQHPQGQGLEQHMWNSSQSGGARTWLCHDAGGLSHRGLRQNPRAYGHHAPALCR